MTYRSDKSCSEWVRAQQWATKPGLNQTVLMVIKLSLDRINLAVHVLDVIQFFSTHSLTLLSIPAALGGKCYFHYNII